MQDVLAKIKALIALTASSNVDEARNAALAAVRLIREHNVFLTLPAPVPPSFPAPKRVKIDDWRKIKAKYNGKCALCGEETRKNTKVWWSPAQGAAVHIICFESWGTPRPRPRGRPS